MLDRLGEMKILDAPVLMRLYKMYRYQVEDEESTTYSGDLEGFRETAGEYFGRGGQSPTLAGLDKDLDADLIK